MSKIIGIVTSYYPNLDELEYNINTYLPYIDHLIVWENTPSNESQIKKLLVKFNNKIEIRTSGKNEYLAYPFNQSIQYANENGYSHLLIMDQDSFFIDGDCAKYIDIIKKNSDKDIAVFSPVRHKNSNITEYIIEVNNTISSGSVFPVDIFKALGYFREDFLIYMVDIEFCNRARRNNYKIVSLPGIAINHKEGYAIKSKLGLTLNLYSAQSTYYIIRNTILTWKLYPEFYALSERLNFYRYKIIYRIIKMIFEPDKFRKIKALYLGVKHGYQRKTGRFDIV